MILNDLLPLLRRALIDGHSHTVKVTFDLGTPIVSDGSWAHYQTQRCHFSL